MNETEALIVTKDEGLVHEVERLLAGQGLRVHVSEDWKQPFTERGNTRITWLTTGPLKKSMT